MALWHCKSRSIILTFFWHTVKMDIFTVITVVWSSWWARVPWTRAANHIVKSNLKVGLNIKELTVSPAVKSIISHQSANSDGRIVGESVVTDSLSIIKEQPSALTIFAGFVYNGEKILENWFWNMLISYLPSFWIGWHFVLKRHRGILRSIMFQKPVWRNIK